MNILTMQGLSTDKVINPLGGLGVVAQHNKLRQDIATLILTRKGSVIGNPAYGSDLHTYLFETASDQNNRLASKEICSLLEQHYNFIQDVQCECTVESETHSLYITISYSTLNTNLSTKLEYRVPLNEEGGIDYEQLRIQ